MSLTLLKENLEKLGYTAHLFENRREAADYLDAAIDQRRVGMGGSITLKELQLAPRLAAHNELIWHWEPTEGRTVPEMLAAAAEADVYLSSVNAIAETGEIVNIDGNCNRVSSILYGHEAVYLVIGRQKVAATLEEALLRAKNVAAPKNAARLERHTPCVTAGRCMNCSSPERICRATVIMDRPPRGPHYEILLINEELGY
ncbi:MAG: lactate utilization protein [Clostridia bacterium]|nr:lactate utilization protein [Clostridia bacterium]